MASKNLSPTGKHAYPLDRIGTHLEIGDTECNNQEQGSTDAHGHGDDHASTSSETPQLSTTILCSLPNIGKILFGVWNEHKLRAENNFFLLNLPFVET